MNESCNNQVDILLPDFRPQKLKQRSLLAFSALLVGALAGLGAIAFREGFAWIQTLCFGASLSEGVQVARSIPAWKLLLIPTLGGLITALIAKYCLSAQRPFGVAEVITASDDAADESSKRIKPRDGLFAILASTVSIGTGASVGREGPMVHLGASLGALVARKFKVSIENTKQMLAWGVAGGVAASFNAPIAGTIFAAEVVLGHYKPNTFAPIAVASVTSTIVSRLYFGELHEFAVPALAIRSYAEIPSFLLLGMMCALASYAFIRLPSVIQQGWNRLKAPSAVRPMIAGLLTGVIACKIPEVLGVGYESTSLAIAGGIVATSALTLALVKLLATSICFGSNCHGGIFSPSLMIGALLGVAWAYVVMYIAPESASSPSVYALIGMGAMAAANLGAPLSTVIIIFEMTGNYPVTLAVLTATLSSSVVVNQLWGYSYFTWLLRQREAS